MRVTSHLSPISKSVYIRSLTLPVVTCLFVVGCFRSFVFLYVEVVVVVTCFYSRLWLLLFLLLLL